MSLRDIYADLPFVARPRKRDGATNWWNVSPTGDYLTDCLTGGRYAAAALAVMASEEGMGMSILQSIASSQAGRIDGIEVGFWTHIANAAVVGRGYAARIEAIWADAAPMIQAAGVVAKKTKRKGHARCVAPQRLAAE